MSAKTIIYLPRNDLRLFDNPVIQEVSRAYGTSAPPFTHFLPIYVFRAKQIELSGLIPECNAPSSTLTSPYPEARSRIAGLWRCGQHRARFLAESVWDLKTTFEQRGCGLVIRAGTLEDVIRDAFQYIDQSQSHPHKVEIGGVWMTQEHGFEEQQEESAVKRLVEASGREFRLFDNNKYLVEE